ncbi:uncharacterized protein LOC122263203 [Penaeus japonicus]|uniref:uncharacterized protein LOC122263203 n=1 Tax=Penaeus japonicus TaxID=27405 RepID=UPI001C711202|nr:uncharacterized protein LOC122263203 [Penaeus japonicus]
MKLQTGWVFAALLWAVGARPQGESRQGAVEETSSAPLDEGLKALVSRVSVRLMCAGKDVPDCESSAASCLTEYGLGSDSPPDFEKVCQGKNQLLCYTKISECVDLLSVSPSAGQLLVSEACSGKTTTDCVQDTIQCMSMLGPGSDTLCPPTG